MKFFLDGGLYNSRPRSQLVQTRLSVEQKQEYSVAPNFVISSVNVSKFTIFIVSTERKEISSIEIEYQLCK